MDTEKQLNPIGDMSAEIHQLAADIDQFYDDFDPLDNTCSDTDTKTDNIKLDDISYYRDDIQECLRVLEDCPEHSPELIITAKDLLRRLNEIEIKLKTDNKHN